MEDQLLGCCGDAERRRRRSASESAVGDCPFISFKSYLLIYVCEEKPRYFFGSYLFLLGEKGLQVEFFFREKGSVGLT